MKLGFVDKIHVAMPGDWRVFVRDHHLTGDEQPIVYPCWGMSFAFLIDFSNVPELFGAGINGKQISCSSFI